jgi:hypothetical protein
MAPMNTQPCGLDSKKQLIVIAGAIAAALVTVCFFSVFWNRFLGIRSGDGGFTAGVFFLKGILPYRDYYCPTPPLFILRSAALIATFGKLPIVLKVFGIVERLLLTVLLYSWLVRFFRVKDVTLAVLVTIILSSGDISDPISSYNHFTILLAIISGLVASYALDSGRKKWVLMGIGYLVGTFALLCIASKQTIGVGISVLVPMVVTLSLWQLDKLKSAIAFLTGFCLGWLVTAGIFLGLMAHVNLVTPFLKQIFIEGPAAKASHPGDFITHTFLLLKKYKLSAIIALLILPIMWLKLPQAENISNLTADRSSLTDILLITALGISAIFLASLFPEPFHFQNAIKPAIYLSFFGSTLLFLRYTLRFLINKLSRQQAQLGLFAAVAFTIAFMSSLSFPVFEVMIIPGLALVLTILLNNDDKKQRWFIYAVCGILVFCQTEAKENIPFGFNGWNEPSVQTARFSSNLPELKGFLLPAVTVNFIQKTLQLIERYSTPADTIFTYPEFGFFYGASERMPATFSLSHNIDTVSDTFAKKEAERVLQTRPAVLIYAPEANLLANEKFWRNGQPSGQRNLISAAETLARQYILVDQFKLPPSRLTVYVFIRPDKFAAG